LPQTIITGSGWASLLLGNVNGSSSQSPYAIRTIGTQFAGFAQDQWRATRKLTVNYGLRWDLGIPPRESHDRFSSFDPNIPNGGWGGLLGAVAFWGDGPGRNGRRTSLDTYYRAFGPRLGLAYALDKKTVLRAYYGIAYSPISVDGSSG